MGKTRGEGMIKRLEKRVEWKSLGVNFERV